LLFSFHQSQLLGLRDHQNLEIVDERLLEVVVPAIDSLQVEYPEQGDSL
jgi:hypothetical protein